MCRLCNERLLAAAQAASMLADAAKDLYNINASAASKVLADAAAELFRVVKDEPKTGDVSPELRKSAEDAGQAGTTAPGEPQLPQGFHIDDDGVVFINGLALGRVVVISKPTKH